MRGKKERVAARLYLAAHYGISRCGTIASIKSDCSVYVVKMAVPTLAIIIIAITIIAAEYITTTT